jgi:hypothetical protein
MTPEKPHEYAVFRKQPFDIVADLEEDLDAMPSFAISSAKTP